MSINLRCLTESSVEKDCLKREAAELYESYSKQAESRLKEKHVYAYGNGQHRMTDQKGTNKIEEWV